MVNLKKNGNDKKHEKDNLALQTLCKVANPVAFPSGNLWLSNMVVWKSEIGEIVKEDIGKTEWDTIVSEVRTKYSLESDGLNKNAVYIGYVLTEAWEKGKQSESLKKLITAILDFATTIKSSSVGGGFAKEEIKQKDPITATEKLF